MNNVCMAYSFISFILHGIPNNQTEWDIVRYPYKSVYGLPKSLNCDESIRNSFYECEKSSHHTWKITVDDYFYETKELCCFIMETMNCESNVAKKCNEQYSKKLESNTRDTFKKVCDKIVGSNYGWHCWWTEERQIKAGIVASIIVLAIIVICAYTGYRIYNDKKITKSPNPMGPEKVELPPTTTNIKPKSIKTIQREIMNDLYPMSIETPPPTPPPTSLSSSTAFQFSSNNFDNIIDQTNIANNISQIWIN
uniref:Uncharacterized protein LOC113791248 n=1 Tax=Dermatophagoides pteronyssinus TaxID=6956 RepID=A0A6P6XXY6_DERPT|nr:uncharacterized protein LOC113791248 [Dermatophagoides pteronyssinus]